MGADPCLGSVVEAARPNEGEARLQQNVVVVEYLEADPILEAPAVVLIAVVGVAVIVSLQALPRTVGAFSVPLGVESL